MELAATLAATTLGGSLTALSIIVLSYVCHFNVLPVHRALPPAGRGAMGAVVIGVAHGMAAATFGAVGLLGLLTFGEATSGDALSDYSGTVGGRVCRALVAASLLTSLPLLALEGVRELVDLCRLPSLDGPRARILYNGGQ